MIAERILSLDGPDWQLYPLLPNEQHRAVEIGLGLYFAGSTLAANERLGATYRPAAELSRQHFGATLIEVDPLPSRRAAA